MSGFQTDTITLPATDSPAGAAADFPAGSLNGFPADSLNGFPADSLTVSAADSLPDILTDGAAQIWDAAAVYGQGSSAIANGLADAIPFHSTLGDNVWFHALTLAVLAGYCYMVYHYREQVLACLRSLIDFKPDDKLAGDRGHAYNRFIAYAVALSTFSAGMALTKAVSEYAETGMPALPPVVVSLGGVILWALTSVIVMLQIGILRGAGKLTLSTEFTGALIDIKTTHLAAAAIFITPAVVLYSGTHPVWDSIILYIAGFELLITGAGFIARTFLLFMRQKVSILVWILYLCAVEIFPLALATALMVKHF